jgi:hypothetical protein
MEQPKADPNPNEGPLQNVGVKVPPALLEWLESESETRGLRVGTLSREYLQLGIDAEKQSPGLYEAQQFLAILKQLPAESRSLLWAMLYFLQFRAIQAELITTEDVPKEQLRFLQRATKMKLTSIP